MGAAAWERAGLCVRMCIDVHTRPAGDYLCCVGLAVDGMELVSCHMLGSRERALASWRLPTMLGSVYLHAPPTLPRCCARCAEGLRREVEELRRKLDDSKKQLQGNEQMIRWLNNQVGLATGEKGRSRRARDRRSEAGLR